MLHERREGAEYRERKQRRKERERKAMEEGEEEKGIQMKTERGRREDAGVRGGNMRRRGRRGGKDVLSLAGLCKHQNKEDENNKAGKYLAGKAL